MFERQAIAGLDLQRCDPLGHQRACPPQRSGEEQFVAGGARRRDRAADAAAGACDLFVAHALQALFELAGAVAAVDQVRVAVDQPRGDERALEIVFGVDLDVRRQRVVGADPDDTIVLREQRAACDLAIPAAGQRDPALGQRDKVRVPPQGLHAGRLPAHAVAAVRDQRSEE